MILRAASKCFVCKIVLFSEENTEHRIIEATNLPNIPNIYLQKTPGKFLSLTFKTEDVALYDKLNINSEPVYDNVGRAHLKTPYSGHTEIFLRAQRFNSTTAATHVNDMLPMMKKEMENGKSIFFVLSDNGPDFNPASLLNTLFYYRLFRYLQMDMLCVFTYAARYSAYNPIEH